MNHQFRFSKLANNKLFYDVIYNPEETNFLKEGKNLVIEQRMVN